MGVNVKVGTLTQPGSTGVQTYNLPVNFGVQAVLFFGVDRDADGNSGSVDSAGMFLGAATHQGSVKRHGFSTVFSESGDQAASHYGNGIATAQLPGSGESCLRLYGPDVDTDPPSIDMQGDFDSFGLQGGSSQRDTFAINWTNLHTLANLRVHYIAIGGTDITDARVFGFLGSGATPQDVTVVTGFGQPDLLMLAFNNSGNADFGGTNTDADPSMCIGWGKNDSERMASGFRFDDGVATMAGGAWQKPAIVLGVSAAGASVAEANLAARASWPTDGFRLDWTTVTGDFVACLALKGSASFKSKIGTFSSPTAGSPPFSEDIEIGFTPKGVMFFHNVLPTNASPDGSHADLSTFHIGAYDGTDEINTCWSEDDGSSGSRTRVSASTTKGLRFLTNSGGTLTTKAEADVSFVGTKMRLTWASIDAALSREAAYIVFGEEAATPAAFRPVGRRG